MFIAKDITDKPHEWEAFVSTVPFQPFPESSTYVHFYQALGEEGSIVGVYHNEKLVGGSVVVSTHAKRGHFLFLPYGPLIGAEANEAQILEALRDFLVQKAKKEGYDFIRVSPFLEATASRQSLWKQIGFRRSAMHVLAEDTWILNVFKENEALLADMNKNHRNLIRRLEREGVKITTSDNVEDLSDLHTLLDITAKRHKFHRFSESYIDAEFVAFAKEGNAVLFRSYLPDGRLDGAAIIMYYGNMAAYRHSGSLGLDPRLPTSYLLQWQAIKEAKARKIEWYNFWGIAPEGASKKHPFFGITHFKKGFGGSALHLLPCQDLPISSKYVLTRLIEQSRRIWRGFA